MVGFFLAVADLAPAGSGDLAGLDGGGGEPGMLGCEFSDAWENRACEEHGDFDGVLPAPRVEVGKGLVGVFVAAAGARIFVGVLGAAGAEGLIGVLAVAAAVVIARVGSRNAMRFGSRV